MVGHVNLADQLVQNDSVQSLPNSNFSVIVICPRINITHVIIMKSWEQEFKRHPSSCSPQLLRHKFTTMHTYTVTLDIASHQHQIVYIMLSNKMLSKIVQSFFYSHYVVIMSIPHRGICLHFIK